MKNEKNPGSWDAEKLGDERAPDWLSTDTFGCLDRVIGIARIAVEQTKKSPIVQEIRTRFLETPLENQKEFSKQIQETKLVLPSTGMILLFNSTAPHKWASPNLFLDTSL